jgi:Flp pilus assembly protein TadG
MSRRKQVRRGATVIEFVLVAFVFFLLIFGLIETGRMVMIQQALTNAAREGCRAAGLASSIDTARVESAVRDYLQSVVGSSASNASVVRVTLPSTLTNIPSGTELSVAVELNYRDASWLPLDFVGLDPTIAAEATRQRE